MLISIVYYYTYIGSVATKQTPQSRAIVTTYHVILTCCNFINIVQYSIKLSILSSNTSSNNYIINIYPNIYVN